MMNESATCELNFNFVKVGARSREPNEDLIGVAISYDTNY